MKGSERNLLLISLTVFVFWRCGGKADLDEVAYIKILSFGGATKTNAYNKGMGLYAYGYYVPASDSFVYKALADEDDNLFLAKTGYLANDRYRDTLSQLIQTLRQYLNPITFDAAYTGNAYHGAELYVEFKDRQGSHSSLFIEGYNDTLDRF